MDTILCSSCGKQIPADAIRCAYCGRIQKFGHQNFGEGLNNPANLDIHQPSQDSKPDSAEAAARQKAENSHQSKDSAPAPEGNLKRLNSLLTGRSIEPDLEALRREGFLPDVKAVKGSAPIDYGATPETGSDSEKRSSLGLPAWLGNTGANPDGIDNDKVDDHDGDAPPASLAELPDWVRKLQNKIQARDDGQQVDELDVSPIKKEETTEKLRTSGARLRNLSPMVGFHEPESRVIESVVAYLGGLKTPRKTAPEKGQRLSRRGWGVIGLAMFSLIAALLWSGSNVSVLSQPAEVKLADMTTFIETLSPESVVLIGMDYDVSLAGEIDNAALPILVHLMRKQVNLVFVSTRPTGSALSGHLIDLGMTWFPDYALEKAFVFSYLPGEAAGLLQLAIDPRRALMIDVDGSNPWLIPELSRIEELTDFSLVVLLTDSTGSGKDWLEQVQPRLGDVPLFAIVSKQAEPLYLPYQESGQLQAMLAGISEGANYEQIYLFTTNNQTMLRAYRGGLLFMAILLACVILLSIFPQSPTIKLARRTRKHASR
jgi:hypothetical protein